MFTVYVLFSERFNKIYIGMTSNLEERIKSHNELGIKGWTKNFRPWIILFQEEYPNKSEALK
jgi:putative endonuclease